MLKTNHKQKLVELKSVSISQSATGQPVKTFTTYASVRGFAKSVMGLGYYAQEQTANEVTVELTIWYRTDVSADDQVLIDGLVYEVSGPPENVNLMNRELMLRLRRVK